MSLANAAKTPARRPKASSRGTHPRASLRIRPLSSSRGGEAGCFAEKRVLVSGGAASLASHLCERLLDDGAVGLMRTPDTFTGPVDIGNPGEFTILQLAQIVVEMTGSRSQITRRPLPQDDPRQRRRDILLAKQTLGWEPKVARRDGLARTIAYCDDLLSAGEPAERTQRGYDVQDQHRRIDEEFRPAAVQGAARPHPARQARRAVAS